MGDGWQKRNWDRLARNVLSGCALMAMASSCLTDVALEGVDGSAGDAGRVQGGGAGSGDAPSRAASGGSGVHGASAGRGGASPSVGSGGSAPGSGGSAGRAETAGQSAVGGAGGSADIGGQTGSAGAPDAGTSQGLGGAADAEGGAPSEGGGGGTDPSPTQDELEQQTIARWNEIADNHLSDAFSFHWVEDRFPHPTFAAMGSAQGYGEFAIVLDEFLDLNFEFLAEYHQFLTPYYYVTVATSDVDLMVTFDQLATDFSTGYGDTPAEVRQSLAAYAAEMKQYE